MRAISIIGAGPVGCYAAYLLADKFDVTVYEANECAGKFSRCSGVLTNGIFNIIDVPKEIITSVIHSYTIRAKSEIKINLDKPDIVVNRRLFDKHLYQMAKDKGVKFKFNHKVQYIDGGYLHFGDNKFEEFDILIGADGPLSKVSEYIGSRPFNYLGIQFLSKNSSLDKSNVDIELNNQMFGWSIPTTEGQLIGCMTHNKTVSLPMNKEDIVEMRSGLIPEFRLLKPTANSDDAFLIGDAAGMVKATTGGGIIPGLKSAHILADSLNGVNKPKFSVFKLYLELLVHKIIRRVLDNMSEVDNENLILQMRKPKNLKVIENVSREKLTKCMFKLILKNPIFALKNIKFIF